MPSLSSNKRAPSSPKPPLPCARASPASAGPTARKFDPNRVPEVAGARANYESAQAQARLAAADAKRYANLVASGDVSRSAYEKARTQQETAEAQANAARQQYEAALNSAKPGLRRGRKLPGVPRSRARPARTGAKGRLADTTIRAPFDGYVTARPVAAGEYVALTTKIATIVRIGTLKLQLQTPEQRAARVQNRHDRHRPRLGLSRSRFHRQGLRH